MTTINKMLEEMSDIIAREADIGEPVFAEKIARIAAIAMLENWPSFEIPYMDTDGFDPGFTTVRDFKPAELIKKLKYMK